MATSTTKVNIMSLRLLIDNNRKIVLFAEADKEFVDFLFNLMSLPLGKVVSLLSNIEMVGSLSKVYQSIEDLSLNYIQSNFNKEILLNPKAPIAPCITTPLLLPNTTTTSPCKKAYLCGHYNNKLHKKQQVSIKMHPYVAEERGALCPQCHDIMSMEASYVALSSDYRQKVYSSSSEELGCVKGVVTYMVMDDLQVKPMSTISSITILNTLNVKDLASLEDKMVLIGVNEGLSLLKASMQSKTVLTDVFMRKKTT